MPRVVHFDLPADDADQSLKFYAEVFGWTHQTWSDPAVMTYHLLTTGPEDQCGIDGGLGQRQDEGQAVSVTIGVEDLEAALERLVAAGGQVVMPKMPIPGVGWFAMFLDTELNAMSVLQADPEAK